MGFDKCLAKLIRSGADVNLVDFHRRFPLMNATESGNTECLKFLVDAGASVNGSDNKNLLHSSSSNVLSF